VLARTTTERFVAQEIMRLNSLQRFPKPRPLVKIKGSGSDQNAV
jgi:hypothetical protein